MSSDSDVIDLTDELPSNKRQRLQAGECRYSEVASPSSDLLCAPGLEQNAYSLTRCWGAGANEEPSSRSFPGSLGQATGSRDSFLKTSPAKKLGGKRPSSRKQCLSPELDSNLFELGTVRLPCEVNELMLLDSVSCITRARHRTSALGNVQQVYLAFAGGTTRSTSLELHTFPGCTHLLLWLCKEARWNT